MFIFVHNFISRLPYLSKTRQCIQKKRVGGFKKKMTMPVHKHQDRYFFWYHLPGVNVSTQMNSTNTC
jgi:hypothetical protein